MKKIFITLVLIISMIAVSFAQAPQKFTYQAVVRDGGNALITNHEVGVRISILQGGGMEMLCTWKPIQCKPMLMV